jgi:hypothetical protein
MKMTLRWTVLASALAAGVMLVTGSPAGAAGAATARSTAAAAAAQALGNYRISGDEDAIGCLTAHRCVAVGYGGGKAPGQVVTVVAGKQVRVAAARPASNLVGVSCPDRFGCWALGPVREGHRTWALVKIGSTGRVTKVTSVRLPRSFAQGSISCTSMTSCELFGITNTTAGFNDFYLASWNGSRLSQPTLVGQYELFSDMAGGISCWQTTCVAVGAYYCPGSVCYQWQYAIMTTSNGKLEAFDPLTTGGTLSGVSCVSASTCYATTTNGTVLTLDDGAVESTAPEPVSGGASIECAGTTCWAAAKADGAASFFMIINGAPAGTSMTDPALTAVNLPSIARRGSGFAAVGQAAVDGSPRVSEVVTN